MVLWRKKHLSLDELLLLHSGEIKDSLKPEKHLKERPKGHSAVSNDYMLISARCEEVAEGELVHNSLDTAN